MKQEDEQDGPAARSMTSEPPPEEQTAGNSGRQAAQEEAAGTISDVLRAGAAFLKSKCVPEARVSAEMLLSHVLKRSRISLYVDARAEVSFSSLRLYRSLLTKRAERYPLQYLLASAAFRAIELAVGPGCAIPRPETELLVEAVLERTADGGLRALDVGTGSGNVAIALALERPGWSFAATDISAEALAYARANARKCGVEGRIRFAHTDLWEGLAPERFHVVLSNPPYLTSEEMASLQPEVRFEPPEAFDGKRDGLVFYERIAAGAPELLVPGGALAFEVGLGQAEAVAGALERHGFENILIRKDYSKIDRIVLGVLGPGAGFGRHGGGREENG